MSKRWLCTVGAVLLLTAAFGVYAQEEAPSAGDPARVLQLLSFIPDVEQTRVNLISYGDIRASEQLRAGVTAYGSAAEFLAASADAQALWEAALSVDVNPAMTIRLRETMQEMPDRLGFDFFDIDRTMQFRYDVYPVAIVAGRFDIGNMTAVLRSRGYSAGTNQPPPLEQDALVWCGSVGCNNGSDRSNARRNNGNIFGGELGQEHPLALFAGRGVIVAGPVYDHVLAAIDASADRTPSLADAAPYQAVVRALEGRGALRSLSFIPKEVLVPPMMAFLMPPPGPNALPDYEIAFIADMVQGDGQQVALVGLVYASAADADVAAERLPARLADDPATALRPSWGAIIAELGGSVDEVEIATDEAGLTLALMPIVYAAPQAASTPSGHIYRRLFEAIQGVDLPWLAAGQ
ncbi:MAG: hypothetical protein SNJ80_05630 [Anaerolinea sp.]